METGSTQESKSKDETNVCEVKSENFQPYMNPLLLTPTKEHNSNSDSHAAKVTMSPTPFKTPENPRTNFKRVRSYVKFNDNTQKIAKAIIEGMNRYPLLVSDEKKNFGKLSKISESVSSQQPKIDTAEHRKDWSPGKKYKPNTFIRSFDKV